MPLNNYWYDEVDARPFTLKHGDSGEDVKRLQRWLRAVDGDLTVDGDYGPATERAVRKFQRAHDLVADGITGSKTMAALEDLDVTHLLGQSDISRAAMALDVPVAAVMAVNEVESRGNGFLPNGRPVILFERHWMRRLLEKAGINPAPWQAERPDIVNSKPGGYMGGEAEHFRLNNAKSIHPASAYQSASWGLFQIMGFHYERLGFESPESMAMAAAESEGNQLDMFVAFIKADPDLHNALKALDWHTFARIYNGPAYASHNYHGRMANAFARHNEAKELSA